MGMGEYGGLEVITNDDLIYEELKEYVKNDDFEDRISLNAEKIFYKKYTRNKESPKYTLYRVATSIADAENTPEKKRYWAKRFYETMSRLDFLPAGRILANVGTPVGSLFNCYVVPIYDSIEEIGKTNANVLLIHKKGGGTGIDWTPLRPFGSFVEKSEGIASGPLSFLLIIDVQTGVINSGNRRGANMGSILVFHPDIFDFIYAKSKYSDLKLSNFNLSIGVTNEFMEMVKVDGYYELKTIEIEHDDYYNVKFKEIPFTKEKLERMVRDIEKYGKGGTEIGKEVKKMSLYLKGNKVYDKYKNKEVGRVNERGVIELRAREVMRRIAEQAWDRGDPGILFIDTINRDNPFPGTKITTTNPCGEQPLLPNEACDLGSINLVNMLKKNGTKYEIDKNKLKRTVITAVRMLDNVNDINKGPTEEIERITKAHRRIGLGVMGLADMLMKMELPYDSEEGRKVAGEVIKLISEYAKEYSIGLAKVKGVFEAWDKSIYKEKGVKIRNVARTTIAPTGSISMVAGVNGGIEPYFRNVYKKIMRGKDELIFLNETLVEKLKERGLYTPQLINKIIENGGSVQNIDEIPDDLKRVFKTALEIDADGHILMQAEIQKYIDNAVSKTINMPHSATIDDVLEAYIKAYDLGLKGITIYRDGSLDVQILNSVTESKHMSKVPDILPGIKIEKKTDYGKFYSFISYDKNYNPLEVFITIGKSGGDIHANVEALGRLISSSLRLGVDPLEIIEQLYDIKSSPSRRSIPSIIAYTLAEYLIRRDNKFVIDESRIEKEIDMFMNGLKKEKIRGGIKTERVMHSIRIKQHSGFGNVHMEITYDDNKNPLETFVILDKSGADIRADAEAMGRLVSLYLRHNGSPEDIIKQLNNIGGETRVISREGTVKSIGDAIAKALQKYNLMKEKGLIDKLERGEDISDELEKLSDTIREGKKEDNMFEVELLESSVPKKTTISSYAPQQGCHGGSCGD